MHEILEQIKTLVDEKDALAESLRHAQTINYQLRSTIAYQRQMLIATGEPIDDEDACTSQLVAATVAAILSSQQCPVEDKAYYLRTRGWKQDQMSSWKDPKDVATGYGFDSAFQIQSKRDIAPFFHLTKRGALQAHAMEMTVARPVLEAAYTAACEEIAGESRDRGNKEASSDHFQKLFISQVLYDNAIENAAKEPRHVDLAVDEAEIPAAVAELVDESATVST